MEQIKAIDVKIFPHRRLKPKTTEKVLNGILEDTNILRLLINGESLPKIVNYGPARGTTVDHPDRKIINLKGEELELLVSVGEIVVTIKYDELEDFLKKLEGNLKKNLNFAYDVKVGIFTRNHTTVSDYLKVGYGIEKTIDPRTIGLVDPKTKSNDTVKLIGD